MKKTLLVNFLFLILSFSAYTQPTFNGTYTGVVNDVNAIIQITENGDQISGIYQEGDQKLNLRGIFSNNEASGEMSDPASGTALSTFYFLLNGNNLSAQFAVLGLVPVEAVFTRTNSTPSTTSTNQNTPDNSTASKPPASSELDPALFGTWMIETITNSGSGSDYAGFTSVRYYTFNEDGTYSEETASAGGGSGWSTSSGRELQSQGWWKIKDGRIHLKNQPDGSFNPMLKHFFHDGNLVFKKDDGKYLIYHK
ncbi:MAG: lipocalin family protein [Bacteroidetes bacterium]|nr:lipocalin family protein [Bacteroidota bacterium]